MDQISKRRRYNIALEMGVLYSIIILYTTFSGKLFMRTKST